jgi:hypothetical protein
MHKITFTDKAGKEYALVFVDERHMFSHLFESVAYRFDGFVKPIYLYAQQLPIKDQYEKLFRRTLGAGKDDAEAKRHYEAVKKGIQTVLVEDYGFMARLLYGETAKVVEEQGEPATSQALPSSPYTPPAPARSR